jgi:hypothetical protein
MPPQTSDTYEAELLLFQSIVNSIMNACAEANTHFDRAKFAKACGLDMIQGSGTVSQTTSMSERTKF